MRTKNRILSTPSGTEPAHVVVGNRRSRGHRVHKSIGALVCATVLLAGCSSSTNGGPSSNAGSAKASGDASLRSQLPMAIVDSGQLTVATDGTLGYPYALAEKGSSKLQGLDVDLANALGRAVGLKVKIVDVPFASLIPGIQSGRYNASISVAFDTKERQKVVDIVDFLRGGSGFLVRKDGGRDGLAIGPVLCGLTIGVLAGSVEVDELKTATSTHCKGKSPITVRAFPSLSQAVLALQSSRVDAVDGDSLQNEYITKQNSELMSSGEPYGVVPIGMLVPKSGNVATTYSKVFQKLIANGEYGKILDKWGVISGAVKTPTVNGG